jgi:hypothetical protein
MKNVIVKFSPIQGKGVYALKDFNNNDIVLTIDDNHVVTDTNKLSDEEFENHCDYFDDKIVLMQSPEVFINHSCNPSTFVKTINGFREVIAMKDIKSGDEITYDYSINGDNDGTFKCRCGSKNCRKIYQGNFFKLPLKIKKKYVPYLDDWFVARHKAEIDKLL